MNFPAKQLKIEVDPRMELLIIAQSLSNYEEILRNRFSYSSKFIFHGPSDYCEAIERHFGNYKNHKLIGLINDLSSTGFWLGAPVETMLFLSPPPALEQTAEYSSFVVERSGGLDKLKEYTEALRDFASDSDFSRFFSSQHGYYERLKKQAAEMFKPYDSLALLEDYYGLCKSSYSVILYPLSYGSYGQQLGEAVYYICGLDGSDLQAYSDALLNHTLWHEFSHPIINPLTEEQYPHIEAFLLKNEALKLKLESLGYRGPWDECINEHLIRAVTLRLAEKVMGKPQAEAFLHTEQQEGFSFVEALAEALKTYENNRAIYPTLKDYYKELLKVFGIFLEA